MGVDAKEAAKNALECVLQVKKNESILIFCDNEKMNICKPFSLGSLQLGLKTHVVNLKTEKAMRKEIPKEVEDSLAKRRTDIFLNLLRGDRDETVFRIKLTQMETKNRKARLAHCPGITLDMLTEGALALTNEEHRKMQDFAASLMKRLSHTIRLEITNPAGTDLSLSVEGRPFFTDTIIDWSRLDWINIPTGEVTVAPVENSLQGELVCDMAIGGIGPIKAPIAFTVKNGKVQKTESKDRRILQTVKKSLETDSRANILGEFAFGINPKARFVEEFLETEKILGTVHVAFGNNIDMPAGKNPSANHMDLLISKPTVRIINNDKSSLNVLSDGIFEQP